MKITDKTKRKAANQRLKKIKAYYKACDSGDTLYNRNREKFIVLVKHELDDECYFLVQNFFGELLLQKLIYNGSVNIVSVSKDGKQYARNKSVFDSWFSEAQDKLNRRIRRYYNWTSVGKAIKGKYTLVCKKEFRDDYYFVLETDTGKYVVAKLICITDVQAVILSVKEFDENKSVFYTWINEAKSNR